MKILITGSKGQVGSQIINIINRGRSELGEIPYELNNSELVGKGSGELDITDFKMVHSCIQNLRPDVVINAAAYTNVDGAETNKETALKVNAFGPQNLAIVCEEFGAKLVHISTDYVFSGEGKIPYKEYDEPSPQSVYGISKSMGDNFVSEFSSKYFIVRPSWVYGYNGRNFVYTIMKKGREKGKLQVVNDQRGIPTNAEDLSHHILKLITTDKYGIYHCCGHGECSWYDFACKIIEFAEIPCSITPCSSKDYVSIVKRPAYSSLDNEKLRNTVGDEMRYWEDALKIFIEKVI